MSSVKPCKTESAAGKTPVYVLYRNHFDLIWRRAWKRSYEMEGKIWRGYADLEESILKRFMKLAETEGAAFDVEQTISLREFIRRNPGAKRRMRSLIRQGRMGVVGCGEAIIDANQCHGETLIRNLTSGMHYLQKELGFRPRQGGHFDGFGSSAQMPQIFRQAGIRWIAGLAYSKPDAPYWRGLDGSTVFAQGDVLTGPMDTGDYFYDHCYYTPCLTCKGTGKVKGKRCKACDGVGIEMTDGWYPPRKPFKPNLKNGYATLIVRSEEMLPDESLPARVREEHKQSDTHQFEWATHDTILKHWEKEMEACDEVSEKQISSRVDNNPVHSGCLVSRMRVKLAARRAERALFAAERFAGMCALQGLPVTLPDLEEAWLNLPLLYFHDAITGTHIDPAQEELLECAATTVAASRDAVKQVAEPLGGLQTLGDSLRRGQRLLLFNPSDRESAVTLSLPAPKSDRPQALQAEAGKARTIRPQVPAGAMTHPDLIALRADSTLRSAEVHAGVCVLPELPGLAMSAAKVQAATPGKEVRKGQADNGLLRIRWDKKGLLEVIDLDTGTPLCLEKEFRPNSLILEHDIGDPWGTRDFSRPRRVLDDTELVSATRYEGCTELIFAGAFMENRQFAREVDPCVFGLEWTQTVRLWDGVARVDFVTEIYWKSSNRRIRVAFPTPAASDTGVYGIPAGILERERYEMEDNRLYSPNGDWPAVDFFATRPDKGCTGTALFNQGTVSSRIEDGVMMMSLLRSPGFGHCLERYAQDYPMPLYTLRDPGYHCFGYALAPLEGRESLPAVAAEAEAFSWPAPVFAGAKGSHPILGGLTVADEAVSVLALKSAFDGKGWILRLLNRSDHPVTTRVQLPSAVSTVRSTTLLEEPGDELPMEDDGVPLSLEPWKILTLRLQL